MRETILLVDDDRLLLQMYEQRLTTNDYQVITATNGEACLRALEQCNPQAIVLDLVMPGLTGFEVLRRLKEHPSWREIPVVVFSSRGAPEDIDTALGLGAIDYIVKTQSTPSDVVSKVEAILGVQTVSDEPRHVRLDIDTQHASDALQLERDLLCPECGAPMLLDIVMAGASDKEFTGSFICPNGCTTS